MGNYLYDDYEAKMKVTDDVINDNNFYKKLKENFVSPEQIFKFIEIIFVTFKCPPYHTKFLQLFYNNLNILERHFYIVEQLNDDLTKNKCSFHESYNNFNEKLCSIRNDPKNKDLFIHGLVRPKKEAVDYFLLYVNFHIYEFEKVKEHIKRVVKEVNTYPEKVNVDNTIQKIVTEEQFDNQKCEVTYIGQIQDGKKQGQGMLITKNKSNGQNISKYLGEFNNDKKEGVGLLKKDGEQIEGQFFNDMLEGIAAIYSESKKIYVQYKNDKKEGREIELKKDGAIATREYKNGIMAEAYSLYAGNTFFTGQKMGKEDYKGVLYYPNEGVVDVGTFNSNMNLKDVGYRFTTNYSIYCTFNDGKYVPSPCFKCFDNGWLYKGYCDEDGLLHGKDILQLIYTNDEYKGDLTITDMNHGEPTGKHEYYWGDGDYEKMLENGWGIRLIKNKFDNDKDKTMEGTFADNGFPYGPGRFTYKNTKYEGRYDLNTRRCLFISNNRRAYCCNIVHTPRFNEATAKQYQTEVNN